MIKPLAGVEPGAVKLKRNLVGGRERLKRATRIIAAIARVAEPTIEWTTLAGQRLRRTNMESEL